MPLTVAIQMDPIWTVDINADSTFVLAEEAQARGHHLLHYGPADLSMRDGRVLARAQPMTVQRVADQPGVLGAHEIVDLSTVDVILMRQDPPFDMSYITATHILDHIHPATLVVNDPTAVRNAPEKLCVMQFPQLMPPTLITRSIDEVNAFRDEHQDIIVKPLFGNGGEGVFHITPGDENLLALLELYFGSSREPIIVQRYEPSVRAGDKRIILIDGVVAGAVNRVPPEGEARSNMHVGGRPERSVLSAREHEICETIGPFLREHGLIFVGIDVIGDYLTEINVTSPTGIQEINRFDGVRLEAQIWDAIEGRVTASKAA